MFEEHSRRLENDIDGELARRTFAQFKKGTVINYQPSMYTALVDYEGEARKMLNYAGRDLLDGEAVLFTSTPDGQELVLSAPNGPEGLPVDIGFIFKTPTPGGSTFANFEILGPANVTIDWGDGTSQVVVIAGATTLSPLKAYGNDSKYAVQLSGTATRVRIGSSAKFDIIRCTSFGVSALTDMSFMFEDCINLSQVPTTLPPTVTTLRGMFIANQSLQQSLNTWDLTNVTDISDMFAGSTASLFGYNGDISEWDVSNVVNIYGLFRENRAFNQDIGAWDVSSATDMSNMFNNAEAFNQDIGAWDVSSATNMAGMFGGAPFDQDITGWDVSNVTNMSYMFAVTPFNQDISVWDVSSVTNMSGMFNGTTDFNQDIGIWDVSNVTNMAYMFAGADEFDQDIGTWDISNVTDMTLMLAFADSFSVVNYDNLLVGWAALPAVQPNVPLRVDQNYTTAVSGTARGVLTGAPNNWTITDDGGI